MKFKNIISALLAASLAFSLSVSVFADGEEAAETRGKFVDLLYNAVFPEGTDEVQDAFDDIAPGGLECALAWALDKGIVSGYGDRRFGPDDPITREQAAAMLYRCAQSVGKGFAGMWMFELEYDDADEISDYAGEAVRWAVMNEIMTAADNNIEPKAYVGQAQADDIVAGFLKAIDSGIDYLVLVNKLNPLPEDWEDRLDTVTTTNSLGDEVEVESAAYDAYLALKEDLAENDGVYVDLDSARRSVAAQQDIMDRFTEEYGADYAAKTVAQPGYSEHHTGLALDLYLNIDGTDVYYNEDMVQYPEIWEKIHSKLADYGFILRYLDGKEHITGYGYEPWHIRYVGDPVTAHEIMDQPGLTLEVWLGKATDPEVTVDLGESKLYTEDELLEAVVQIKCRFASFEGCELHSLTYAGDECSTEENIKWMNDLDEGQGYTQVVEFLSDFHSPVEEFGAWDTDREYEDWQWWLARTEEGGWQLLTWGY